ncbi:hypothetical protein JOD46_002396 [Agromyces aurantiacus]|nr:hypothetical protein [Agromyces aurantiacus]
MSASTTRAYRSRSSDAASRRTPSACTRNSRSRRAQLGRPCGSPRAGPEGDRVAVVVVRRAGQLHGEELPRRAGRDHDDRAVLAAAVALLVRHPGPHDLARVGLAVALGRVREPHAPDGAGVEFDRGGRARAPRPGLPVLRAGRLRDIRSPLAPPRAGQRAEHTPEGGEEAAGVWHTRTLPSPPSR